MQLYLFEDKPFLQYIIKEFSDSIDSVFSQFKLEELELQWEQIREKDVPTVIISGKDLGSTKKQIDFVNSSDCVINLIVFLDCLDVQSCRYILKSGALDVLSRESDSQDIRTCLEEACSKRSLHSKNLQLEKEKAMLKIINNICLTLEFEPLLNLIIETASEITGADSAEFYFSRKKQHKTIPALKKGELPFQANPDIIHSASKDIQVVAEDAGCLIYIPFIYKEVYENILVLGKKEHLCDQNSQNFILLKQFQKEISPAIQNSDELRKTRSLTFMDDLTKCHNRRYFDQKLPEQFNTSKKKNEKLSLIFMDLDNLKSVNTRYGHLVGSRVLQSVAVRIIDAVRGIDKVSRFGGDEFCIILPDTDSIGAYKVAERIKRNIESKESILDEFPEIQITASFGIASFPEHAQDEQTLLKIADNAMYYVKLSTKNSIFIPGKS